MDSVLLIRLASGLMLLAVAMGAFGAHALKDVLSAEMKVVFETGIRYQAYHSLGLFAAAALLERYGSRYALAAAVCFLIGIVLFSGSLYALSLSGIRKLGAITPLGGTAFLIGWALLALAPYRP